ncbi:molybdopterin-dependent oxidoreductase [Nocardioides sp. cx-173]|uniref:molybdopterin-dependent oxidoreductase n=1 Tax=Nocardioides sp. cx-173 TaxID=2898796 RepID=UPI001E289556|nr:molybdopterin-dependent oxidoreductase [Nocardioides sp. cx-173]MCD4524894.1 molybdopterin-dependent oxidoreductase [Nocardioides sp. cx-173]UGB43397.1 molybdopterin-dependent oxidoreductase [Nocardioides sp. cx-173]
MRSAVPGATRRTVLSTTVAAGGACALAPLGQAAAAPAAPGGPILKPLPTARFVDFGTNAEMRWESVDPRRYLTEQSRLFVRNHTRTPVIDRDSYALRIFGDGLARGRSADAAVELGWRELRRLPTTQLTSVHECTGNGRSLFASQQGTPASGTAWTLGAVGAVTWTGVRLADVLRRVGLDRRAVSVQATGLDDPYVSGGVDYGRVRRPFPIAKALDDALLAWGANGEDLLPDHGYPLRLVLPGWVGIASIKWLGSLEVSRTELTSPWNTKWYRMTGGEHPADSPPLTVNPVRSAWELPWGAELEAGRRVVLTGRSWSGAGPVTRVEVSTDGGATWHPAARRRRGGHSRGRDAAWAQWSYVWDRPAVGSHELLARATDARGRRQPLVTPYNDNGYFFDAVVRHPVTVA